MTKEQILSKAIDLPPIERAQLIEDLFETFSLNRKKEMDKIWADEAERRMKAHDEGKIDAIKSEDVFSDINKWK